MLHYRFRKVKFLRLLENYVLRIGKMKIKDELVALFLWLLTILPTILLVKDSETLIFLIPLYFICMLGSIMVVWWVNQFSGKVTE
jgi:hypothetical protein